LLQSSQLTGIDMPIRPEYIASERKSCPGFKWHESIWPASLAIPTQLASAVHIGPITTKSVSQPFPASISESH
jgi:hypothetical protein